MKAIGSVRVYNRYIFNDEPITNQLCLNCYWCTLHFIYTFGETWYRTRVVEAKTKQTSTRLSRFNTELCACSFNLLNQY